MKSTYKMQNCSVKCLSEQAVRCSWHRKHSAIMTAIVFEPYLAGTEASGLFEARLGAEEMPGKEVHVFCAGYRADEFEGTSSVCRPYCV